MPLYGAGQADQALVEQNADNSRHAEKVAPAEKPPAAPAPTPSKARTYAQLVEAINHCRTALEVLYLHKAFIADATVAESERACARGQLSLWEDRAAKKMIRVGTSWVEGKELASKQERAHRLIEEATKLLEIDQGKLAREKMKEASKADPTGIEADFTLGLGYALLVRDAKAAMKHFAECVHRQPGHISSLNNLALAEIRRKEYEAAVLNWQTALQLAPASAEIAQNIGRFLDLAQEQVIHVPPSTIKKAAGLVVAADDPRYHRKVGWLYMRFYAPDKTTLAASAASPPSRHRLRRKQRTSI